MQSALKAYRPDWFVKITKWPVSNKILRFILARIGPHQSNSNNDLSSEGIGIKKKQETKKFNETRHRIAWLQRKSADLQEMRSWVHLLKRTAAWAARSWTPRASTDNGALPGALAQANGCVGSQQLDPSSTKFMRVFARWISSFNVTKYVIHSCLESAEWIVMWIWLLHIRLRLRRMDCDVIMIFAC